MAISKLSMPLQIAVYCLAIGIWASPGRGGGEGVGVERQTVGAGTWCVAREDASETEMQAALDWACGQESGQGNVDCTAISSGGVCDSPDSLTAHASYAFNAYFQNLNQAAGACDFGGCAQTTTSDPSVGACTYSSSSASPFLATGNVSNSSPSNEGSEPRKKHPEDKNFFFKRFLRRLGRAEGAAKWSRQKLAALRNEVVVELLRTDLKTRMGGWSVMEIEDDEVFTQWLQRELQGEEDTFGVNSSSCSSLKNGRLLWQVFDCLFKHFETIVCSLWYFAVCRGVLDYELPAYHDGLIIVDFFVIDTSIHVRAFYWISKTLLGMLMGKDDHKQVQVVKYG
ncbi:hypothetical protein GOP47_0017656 [Adiantum capillus-veneris]|uniref:X8 domain-containing protein n=1 Tax=Adiantum capillus-veneris TaxID=13818 RepID=A0A9D4UGN0_ADICA|nr:hypothetical protein GOP47_0017656 [Adiantum capillus-veneris]